MATNMPTNKRKFKKVLITGVSGSGGSFLAEYILKTQPKIKIFGIYRKQNKLNFANIRNKIQLIKCDLKNFFLLQKILNKVKPDVIFHLASKADVKKSFLDPYNIIYNNNLITLNLLECIRRSKLDPVIQICSTSEVYGNVHKKFMPINESCKLEPNNPYAVSKLFQDVLASNYFKNYNLKIIITRMFTYLNPRRKNLFASSWAYQINRIKSNRQKILTHGNLNSTRTIMDVRDAMRAYWLAAEYCNFGEIYNIGSNYIINLRNFMKLLKIQSNINFDTKFDKKLLRRSDIAYQIPDSRKFRKKTKWKPEISIQESIKYLIKETSKL
jgi:GDP-4-dehydro-6-deoxy-D-mannose reductase